MYVKRVDVMSHEFYLDLKKNHRERRVCWGVSRVGSLVSTLSWQDSNPFEALGTPTQ